MDFSKLNGKIYFINKFINVKNAKIHVLNHSLHFASSIFEGIGVYEGNPLFLKEHLLRLKKSAHIICDSYYTYFYKSKIERTNTPENTTINISITKALSFFGEKDKDWFSNFKVEPNDNTILQRLRISGPCKSSEEYGKPFLKKLFLDEENVYKVILKTDSHQKEIILKAEDLKFKFRKKSVTIKLPKIRF